MWWRNAVDGLKTVRKNINFPFELIAKISILSKELNTDFSKFVREATEERLERIEKEILEKELAEGYKANAKLDLETCEDFKHVDSENI